MEVKFTKLAKMVAAISRVNSMAVVRADSTSTSNVALTVSRRRASANRKAPAAPMPAPSVAVNTPP